ncbi:hypothetical protein HMPREF3291_22455 [Bacillus sp. HMSC76G11]|nr:hypothetical protein HMPREF3291_22455 [Bacillus sp. HMSC76G11]
MSPFLEQSSLRKVNVTELAKKRGMSEPEVESHIKGLVEQGFLKKVDKNTYDVTPLLTMMEGFAELTKSNARK